MLERNPQDRVPPHSAHTNKLEVCHGQASGEPAPDMSAVETLAMIPVCFIAPLLEIEDMKYMPASQEEVLKKLSSKSTYFQIKCLIKM